MVGRAGYDGRAGDLNGSGGEECGFFFTPEHRTRKRNVRKASVEDPGAWWGHVNTLIAHGHGPLPNILAHYTLDHVNNFLAEIDSAERRSYKETIFAARIAQADKKHFKEAVGRIERQERQIRALRRGKYRAEGKSREEAEWLVKHTVNAHVSELPKTEQERLRQEEDQMWATVPKEFRDRALRMAGLKV